MKLFNIKKINLKKLLIFIFLSAFITLIAYNYFFLFIRCFYIFSTNYNDGWNIYHIDQINRNWNIYNSTFALANYTPLSFYLIYITSKIIGNPLLNARLISFFSLFLTSITIYYVLKKLTQSAIHSLLGVLYFLFAFFIFTPGIAVPDITGLFISLLCIPIFIKFKTNYKFFLIALVFSISLFYKQNLISLPISFALYLLLTNRRAFYIFSCSFLSLLTSFFLLSFLVFGNAFIKAMSINRFAFSNGFASSHLPSLLTFLIIFIFLIPIIILNLKNLIDKKYFLFLIYFIFSFFYGSLVIGGAGIDINHYYDFLLSSALIISLCVNFISKSTKKYLGILLLVNSLICILILYSLLLSNYLNTFNSMSNLKLFEEKTKSEVTLLKQNRGDAICENLLLCYLADKKFEYDPFLVLMMTKNKIVDEKNVLNNLKNKKYSIIQINKETYKELVSPSRRVVSFGDVRFSKNFYLYLIQNYNLEKEMFWGVYFVKK